MPNGVKFSTDTESRALVSGDARIDVGAQIGGPTHKTEYFTGVTPATDGYTVYHEKEGLIVDTDLAYAIDPANYTSYRTDLALDEVWDMSGNQKTGILTNGVSHVGVAEGAFSFDGATTYIDVPSTTADYSFIERTGVYTISAWVRCNTAATGMTILCNSSGTTIQKGFIFFKNNTGNIDLDIYRGVSGQSVLNHDSGIELVNGEWTHITAVGNGSVNQFYKNGVSFGGTTAFGTFSTGDSSQDLNVGRANSTGIIWDGLLGLVSIYNVALNDTQVVQNFNATRERFGL